MKRTLIFSAVMLVLSCFIIGFGPHDAASKPAATGTIEVCWAPYCASAPVTTVINLVDAAGNVVGTCTINPPDYCCKITGDFKTGTYHLAYYHPTGSTLCTTADFRYINGTNVTMSVICHCP